MNPFYRSIALMLATGIGIFLFLHYADTLSRNSIFSHPSAAKTMGSIANYFLVFCGFLILINWVIKAREKTKKEKISLLKALFAVYVEYGESRAKREEAFHRSIPEPLNHSLPNGLFWLLYVIIIGGGAVVFLVWWGQNHL